MDFGGHTLRHPTFAYSSTRSHFHPTTRTVEEVYVSPVFEEIVRLLRIFSKLLVALLAHPRVVTRRVHP